MKLIIETKTSDKGWISACSHVEGEATTDGELILMRFLQEAIAVTTEMIASTQKDAYHMVGDAKSEAFDRARAEINKKLGFEE